jgi:hypothetical protein
MDSASPPAIVEIVTTEHHDIREEVIEQVARLLARQAGQDPDADDRCLQSGMMMNCTLEFGRKPHWTVFRDQAERRLREMFKP